MLIRLHMIFPVNRTSQSQRNVRLAMIVEACKWP